MAEKFVIKIDGPSVDRMLNGRTGPVTRDLERRARNIMAEARRLAPGSMARKITSVTVDAGANKKGASVEIRCSHPATLYVVNGTKPHEIWRHGVREDPRSKRRLKFKGRGGRTVYKRMVFHPGNKPNNFLMKAVRLGGSK